MSKPARSTHGQPHGFPALPRYLLCTCAGQSRNLVSSQDIGRLFIASFRSCRNLYKGPAFSVHILYASILERVFTFGGLPAYKSCTNFHPRNCIRHALCKRPAMLSSPKMLSFHNRVFIEVCVFSSKTTLVHSYPVGFSLTFRLSVISCGFSAR